MSVDHEIEPRLAREVEPGLGFALHLGQRIACRKEFCEQGIAAKRRVGEVAGPLRRIEGAARAASGPSGHAASRVSTRLPKAT